MENKPWVIRLVSQPGLELNYSCFLVDTIDLHEMDEFAAIGHCWNVKAKCYCYTNVVLMLNVLCKIVSIVVEIVLAVQKCLAFHAIHHLR